MNTYKGFYRSKSVECQASTKYEAQKKLATILKAKKSYDVAVELVAIDGKEIIHIPTF